jgi:hypothetical protein
MKILSFRDSAYGGVTSQVSAGNPEILTHVMPFCSFANNTVGGDVTETLAINGLLDTDICFASRYTALEAVHPIAAACGTNLLTTIWSADPLDHTGFDYLIFRAV